MSADSEAGSVRVSAAGIEPPSGERLLATGDRMPDFVLPDPRGQLRFFYQTVTGAPVVFFLFANTAMQEQWDEIKELAPLVADIRAAGADLFIVSNDGIESLEMVAKAIPDHAVWLADIKGVVNLGLRTAALLPFSGVACLVLDGNQRIAAIRGVEAGQARWALGVLQTMKKEEPQSLDRVAPVLLLPGLLESADCVRLLEQIPTESPPAGTAPIADKTLAADIAKLLLRRIGPEIEKAFSFDDFEIGALTLRWDDPSSPAERRREINDPAVEGRPFYLLIDLAPDGYEGGAIGFPEFGPHRYRPGAGGAIIHAGTLLRELAAVGSGRRCLLTATLKR
jgi:hypothetical protein